MLNCVHLNAIAEEGNNFKSASFPGPATIADISVADMDSISNNAVAG